MQKNKMKINIHIYSILMLLLFGCSMMKDSTHDEISQHKYFTSPEESVPVITDLLKNQDFKALAAFYDLNSSKIKRAEMDSGEFFIRKKRPELSHPAEFWQYKHPFAPGFKFNNIQSTEKEDVYLVQVMIVIDQGIDFPKQEGFSEFFMIKSSKGWQILPDQN
jgi:hypothetical protein